jgi:tryptophanyl-tRNA synthetase
MNQEEQKVTPWDTYTKKGKFDYQKLIEQFGVETITPELLERFQRVTGVEPHRFMKRGLFFAHRQLNEILDDYEQGKQIFLYTGRGPSSESLHLGHMIQFLFTKWLQDVFKAIVVIQIADDEKYFIKPMSFNHVYHLGFENAKDIIACGFNPERTFIFSNRDYSRESHVQSLVCDLLKIININNIKKVFGLDDSAPCGQLLWPFYQIGASFAHFYHPIFGNEKPRCLICYAIDQDPYFRVSREISEHQLIKHPKPCSIISQFLPALDGKSKMNATQTNASEPQISIFMTDTYQEVLNKIRKYAFSGGKDTIQEHRAKGADLNVDISYAYLQYFEENDDQLKEIGEAYRSGKMLTSEIKKYLTEKIMILIDDHKKAREKVTPDVLKHFYDITKFQK